MNRIVKALIISLVISSFLVPGSFFAVQKIRQAENLHSLLENKPVASLYAVQGTLRLQEAGGGRNGGSLEVLQKRLQSVCEHLVLEKGTNDTYQLSADGIKDSLLLKKLLTASSSLQWWELYNLGEFVPFLQRADSLLKLSIKKKDTVRADTARLTSVEQLLQKKAKDTVLLSKNRDEHPLYSLLHVDAFVQGNGGDTYPAQLGFVEIKDTPALNSYLINPVVKANMPAEASFFYGKPYSLGTAPFPYLFLYAIKKPEPKPILDESFLTAVRLQPGLRLDEQQVVFKFNRTGTSRLERMTTANINRYIAMVANNEVITAPRVEGAISGGSMVFSAIDGHDPKLVYLLVKYGPLPAPIGIRQLQFAVQPAPSLLKGIWPLVWLLAFALAFLLTLSIDRAFRNMYRERRQ